MDQAPMALPPNVKKGMEQQLIAYIEAHSDSEPALLQQLWREAHLKLSNPRMLSGHLQGRLLKLFCRMVSARRILEIGTYAGYSALCMAEALAPNGVIDTLESNDELESIIRKYISLSPDGDKINLHIGNALAIIPTLSSSYDLVFIDADKREYQAYYEAALPLVRAGGVILADNTLWAGKVIDGDTPDHDSQTWAIKQFNDYIAQDDRVEKVILPLRDGMTIIWKKQ